MRKVFCTLLIFLFTVSVYSQNALLSGRMVLNGYIRDSLSGETIIGASITVNGKSKGVSSNLYGFYSLTLGQGSYEISISHIAYSEKSFLLSLDSSITINVDLVPKTFPMQKWSFIVKKEMPMFAMHKWERWTLR